MDEIRSWWEVPSVAHFCSLFRTAFDLTDFDIEELEDGLLASSSELGSPFLDELLASILRGCYGRQDIERYNYEVYLKDIIKHRWQVEAGRESPLENEEFFKLPLRLKVEILHALCDYRLDADDVSEALKGHDGDNMRVQPMGTDGEDAKYWYFYGIRLYKEDPEPALPAKESKKDLQKKKDKKKKKKDKLKKGKKKNKLKKNKKSPKSDSKDHQPESVPEASTSSAPQPSAVDRWHLICTYEDDWAKLAETFKKTKLPCERRLYKAITEDFIPILPTIIEEREKQRRKRLLETAPRRVSDRLGKKKANFNEQDRFTAAMKAEDDREKMEEEEERKRQLELERIEEQNRLREERMKAKEERAKRVWQREERAQLLADGKEIPPELLYAPDSPVAFKKIKIELEDHVITGMLKVLDAVKAHREAWPFLEPVLEEYAPHYNEIIKRPMDLSTIEKKLSDKVYTSIKQFLNDFQLMYNNCSQYNGPSNEYTLMAGKLIQCMQKAVRRYMTIDQYESDEEYLINAEPSILKMYRPSREASSRAKEVFVRYAEDAQSNSSGPSSPNSVSDIMEGSWNSTDDILSSLTGTPVSSLSKQPIRNSNVLMGMLNKKHTDTNSTSKPGINVVLNGAQVRPQSKIISVTLGRNPITGAQQPLYEQIIQQREQKLQRKMSTNQNEPLSPSQHAPVLYPLVKAAIAKGNSNPGMILTAQQAGNSPMTQQQQHTAALAGKFPPYQLKTGAIKILSTPDGAAKKATPLPALTQYVKSQQTTTVSSDAELVMPKEYKILGSIAKGSQIVGSIAKGSQIVQSTKINAHTTSQQQVIAGIIQPSSSVMQTNLTKENILNLSKSAQLAQSAIYGKPTVVYYPKSNVPGDTNIVTASGLMQQSVSGNSQNATTQILKLQTLPKSLGNIVEDSPSKPSPGVGIIEVKNENDNTMESNTIQNSAGKNLPYFIQASPGHIQNVSRMQTVQNVSRMQTVQNVPRMQTVPNVPRMQTVQNVPRMQTVQNVPRMQTVHNVPRMQTVQNVPRMQTVQNVSRSQQTTSGHLTSSHNEQIVTLQTGTSIIPPNPQNSAPVAQPIAVSSSVATRQGSAVPTIVQSAPVVTNPVQATMTMAQGNPIGTRTLQLATGQKIVLTDEIMNALLAAKASNSPHKIQLVVNASGQVTATTPVCATLTNAVTNVKVAGGSVAHTITSVAQSIQQNINAVPQNIVTSKPSAPPVATTFSYNQLPKKRKLFTSDSDSPPNNISLSGICASKNDNDVTPIVNTNYVASVLNVQGVSGIVAGQPALGPVQGAGHNIATILGSPNSAVTVVRTPMNSAISNMSIPTIHLNSGLIASSGASLNGNTQILKQSQGNSVLVNTVGKTPVVNQIISNNQNISAAGMALQTLVNRQNSAIGNVLRPTQIGVTSTPGLRNVVASGLNQSVPNSVNVNQSVVPTISGQNHLQPVQVMQQVANSSGLNQSVPVPNSVTVGHSVAPTISSQNQLQPVQVVQQVVNSSPQNVKVISIGPGHPYYQQLLLQQQQRQIQAQQQPLVQQPCVIQLQAATPAVSQELNQPSNNK